MYRAEPKNQLNLDLYLVRRYKICQFPIVVSYLCIGQNQKIQPNLVLYLVRRSKIFVSVATLNLAEEVLSEKAAPPRSPCPPTPAPRCPPRPRSSRSTPRRWGGTRRTRFPPRLGRKTLKWTRSVGELKSGGHDQRYEESSS